jgi:uncharacterized protein YndB with AHSA1/START domain
MSLPVVKPIPPLRRTVQVPWTPARSFERFTSEIARWWPLKTHSVGGEGAVHVEFEPRVGGRIVERDRDGSEHEWGRVLAWEPPGLVRFTWHPGQDPATSQEIEVRFVAEGTGTRVELVHSKWERLGRMAKMARRGYPLGWAYVLSLYADRRGPLVVTLDMVGRVAMAIGRLRKAG